MKVTKKSIFRKLTETLLLFAQNLRRQRERKRRLASKLTKNTFHSLASTATARHTLPALSLQQQRICLSQI